MARPLRVDIEDGWYHVTARVNERRAVFAYDADRRRFLELLGEWVERFGLRLHAYVLMENHYHLLVQTPQANLSPAMQWLQISYTVWFNRRHRRVGHLFQGRFKAVVLEREVAVEVSRYVHLNPVRIGRLGLGKAARQRTRVGVGGSVEAKVVAERVQRLRAYRWSSYRAYAGLSQGPAWLTQREVLEMLGGGADQQRRQAYRRFVEQAIREGVVQSPWERLQAGVLLGGAEFVRRMRRHLRGDEKEQAGLRRLRERASFDRAVAVVERLKSEKWETFRDRYGDWGRDLALYLGRKRCGMRLRDLAVAAGGLDYGSVSGAVRRFEQQLQRDKKLAALAQQATRKLENS
ncbi:MAG: transposase [Verrucomicrobiia bacterium]